jgi:hypothetical protein
MAVTGRRYPALAAFLVAAGLLVACGSVQASPASRAWWSRVSGACGPPAVVRLDGHVMLVGDCAALLVIPATKVAMHVGQQIDVHMTGEIMRSVTRNLGTWTLDDLVSLPWQ